MAPSVDQLLDRVSPAPLPPRANVSIGHPAPNNIPMGALPPEIRSLVIIEAFGNRTLHMDLVFEPPPVQLRSVDPLSHVNYKSLRRNALRPSTWEWWGSECRDGPLQIWDKPVDSISNKPRPADDLCGHDGTQTIYGMARPAPGRRPIEVLGWLLSCREAYLETVNVLYGNNTLHIARTYLFLGLPRLFMPERLTAIRDIELLLDFELTTSNGQTLRTNNICTFLDALPRTLPNLKRLYLSFQTIMGRWYGGPTLDGRFQHTEAVLVLIDSMVTRLSHLVECRVAFATTEYGTWKFVANGDQLEPNDRNGSMGATWRDLSKKGGHREGNHGGVEGYWVCHGKTNMHPTTLKYLIRRDV